MGSVGVDIAAQAQEARESGTQEVLKLLQQPEDLNRLQELRVEYDNKARIASGALSSIVQSQVEATRNGLELLERSQRHVMKLKGAIESIHELCQECSNLIDNQDKIKVLSTAHANIQKVLSEIEDIIDLPQRAEMVLALLKDSANMLPAFEALTVLEGTAENAKMAWKRNEKARKHDMSSMLQYLDRVSEVMVEFERMLWRHVLDYENLSQTNPTLLVDCLRVIELQEQLDDMYKRTKMESTPKGFRKLLFRKIERHIAEKFQPVIEMGEATGKFNTKMKYDTNGDLVLDEVRDYLGNLVSVTRISPSTGVEEVVEDPQELQGIEIIEEEVFEEAVFLDELLIELYDMESDLAIAYDFVSSCFPPSYAIFDRLVALYHGHLSLIIDSVGQKAKALSTKGSLRVMEFVRKYMETLRGLGVEEEFVRLGINYNYDDSDDDDDDDDELEEGVERPPKKQKEKKKPGLDLLMECYISRMEQTVTKWYNNIIAVDLKCEPRPGPRGLLRTPGVTDFFRIMNEEIAVIMSIDDHGEVMFQTALCAVRIMQGFQIAEEAVISESSQMSFEMLCAQLNNNVECHDQSVEFAEEVQKQLSPEFRKQLDIDDVCRGFLEVAKIAAKRSAEFIFNDPGMSNVLKAMWSTNQWQQGTSTATLFATIKDYMSDVKRFVEPSFNKRVAESALDVLVRRSINMFVISNPPITEAVVERMTADIDAAVQYFGEHMRPDRIQVAIKPLLDLRQLIWATEVAEITAAFDRLVVEYTNFTVDFMQHCLANRTLALLKKSEKDILAHVKVVWKKLAEEKEGRAQAKGGAWFSWG